MKIISLILVAILICSAGCFAEEKAKIKWGNVLMGSLCLVSGYLIGTSSDNRNLREKNNLSQFAVSSIGLAFLVYSIQF